MEAEARKRGRGAAVREGAKIHTGGGRRNRPRLHAHAQEPCV